MRGPGRAFRARIRRVARQPLVRRRPGLAHLLRARGQTGQQLLLGAYQALCRQISLGAVEMYPRTEMLDLVVINGHAKGIVVRNLITGEVSSHGHGLLLPRGGGERRR